MIIAEGRAWRASNIPAEHDREQRVRERFIGNHALTLFLARSDHVRQQVVMDIRRTLRHLLHSGLHDVVCRHNSNGGMSTSMSRASSEVVGSDSQKGTVNKMVRFLQVSNAEQYMVTVTARYAITH